MGCSFVIGQISNLISGIVLAYLWLMKKYNYIVTMMVVVLGLSSSLSMAQTDNFEQVGKIIKTGNAKELVKQFHTTIELNIDDKEASYSKSQAEAVLKNFFSKYPPIAFTINHKGASKSGLRYAIGQYEYDLGKYRVLIRLKEVNGKYLVSEMSFRKE